MGWPVNIESALPGKIPYGMGDPNCEPMLVWASSAGGAAVRKTSIHTTAYMPRFDVINFMPSSPHFPLQIDVVEGTADGRSSFDDAILSSHRMTIKKTT
jgi:hypothetical protein